MNCPKCAANADEWAYDDGKRHYTARSNGERVREWMQDVGQSTPEAPQIPDLETARLRYKLLSEEAEEACDELDVLSMNIDMGANQEFILRDMRKAGKEMADVLVVAYGGLVALGLDPDEVFAYVMEENEAKTEHAVDRGDGKRVVPPDVKENLKAETKAKLERLVEGAG